MWELICHHTYRLDGYPVDLTMFDNHGTSVPGVGYHFMNDGRLSGSGAAGFSAPSHQLLIPALPGHGWDRLEGIRICADIKLSFGRTSPAQVIVEADQSFNFWINSQCILGAGFTGRSTWPGQHTDGLNTALDAVDPFAIARVPVNQWTQVEFCHNGLDTMELFIDGKLVAKRTSLLSSIPAAGSRGVCLGNSLSQPNCFLDGAIDSIRIWRLDPSFMTRRFLDRPLDAAARAGWERFANSLQAAAAQWPDCAWLLYTVFNRITNDLRRRINAKGPETRERYQKILDAYSRLWRDGQLGTAAMEQLVADWLTWLRLVGVDWRDLPELEKLHSSECLQQFLHALEKVEDPQLVNFIGFIDHYAGNSKDNHSFTI